MGQHNVSHTPGRFEQALAEARCAGDLGVFLEHPHPDATLEVFAPAEFPWIRRATDGPAVRAALAQNFGSVERRQVDLTNIVVDGEMIVLFGREQGRICATGRAYDVEFVEKFSFRDGRLAAVRIITAHVVHDRSGRAD